MWCVQRLEISAIFFENRVVGNSIRVGRMLPGIETDRDPHKPRFMGALTVEKSENELFHD